MGGGGAVQSQICVTAGFEPLADPATFMGLYFHLIMPILMSSIITGDPRLCVAGFGGNIKHTELLKL